MADSKDSTVRLNTSRSSLISRVSVVTPTTTTASPWELFLDSLTVVGLESNSRIQERTRAAVPDKLPSVLFKLDGKALTKALISVLCNI